MAFLKKHIPASVVALLVAALLLTVRTMTRFDILLLDRFLPGLGFVQIAGAAAPKWRRRTWLWISVAFFGQLLLGLTV